VTTDGNHFQQRGYGQKSSYTGMIAITLTLVQHRCHMQFLTSAPNFRGSADPPQPGLLEPLIKTSSARAAFEVQVEGQLAWMSRCSVSENWDSAGDHAAWQTKHHVRRVEFVITTDRRGATRHRLGAAHAASAQVQHSPQLATVIQGGPKM